MTASLFDTRYKPRQYVEYLGLDLKQLYVRLDELNDPRPNTRTARYRDKAERIAFINSEIVLMTGRA